MNIDLSSFLDNANEILHFNEKLNPEDLDLSKNGVIIVEPIEYQGEIFRVDGEKIINIRISYKYKEICHRCLQPTTKNVETALSGKLVEGKKVENDNNDNDDEGYDELIFYEEDSLDLNEYVINQVILSLPMKTLCKEDCKGLCPKCGADLNRSKCDCIHENIDPRLEKLKEFLPKN
ncbi:MAG: DUF177 domain-containing protein [Tissierellia bacterium]|nr:DUF177 domain-containing protein [Tissierellia bacterium]